MSTATVRIPAAPIRLYRPGWAQRWDMFVQAWSAWREQARRRAELRALAALDPRLLKDVGLGEFASSPPRSVSSWQTQEGERW